MKKFFLRVGRLWCVGAALLLMRLRQNQTGFDAQTGLAVRTVPGTVILAALAVCAVGEFLLFLRLPKEKTSFAAQFEAPDKEMPVIVSGSLLLAAGGILLALQAFQGGSLHAGVAGVLGAAAGAGILLLTRSSRAGEELSVMPILPAMLFSVFFVLTAYLPLEDDPVFARYYLPVLSTAMIAYSFSQLAGFLKKESSQRGFVFAADLTVVLCITAIADSSLAKMLLFAGCALVLSVYLMLCRREALAEPSEEPTEGRSDNGRADAPEPL